MDISLTGRWVKYIDRQLRVATMRSTRSLARVGYTNFIKAGSVKRLVGMIWPTDCILFYRPASDISQHLFICPENMILHGASTFRPTMVLAVNVFIVVFLLANAVFLPYDTPIYALQQHVFQLFPKVSETVPCTVIWNRWHVPDTAI